MWKTAVLTLSTLLWLAGSAKAEERYVTLSITNGAMCATLSVPTNAVAQFIGFQQFPAASKTETNGWILEPKVTLFGCDSFAPGIDLWAIVGGPVTLTLVGEPTFGEKIRRFAIATFKLSGELNPPPSQVSVTVEGSADGKEWKPIATVPVPATNAVELLRVRLNR